MMTYSQGNVYDTGTYQSLAGAQKKKSSFKKYFNQCSFYVALWIIYFNQVPLGLSSFIIMDVTILLLVVWSFFHVVKCIFKYKLPHFMKALFLFLMIQTVYGTLHVIMPSFGYQVDTGLLDAIDESNAEIMISCDKYYLVSTHMAHLVADIIQGR